MSRKLSYWIKERHNPQFKKPYYHAYGQLTKKEARAKENTLYGHNVMLEYKTEQEYIDAIKALREKDFIVY